MAGISTAGPPVQSAPAGRRTGAAAAPFPGGRSCRQDGAETGEAAARGWGQRGLARPWPLLMAQPVAGRGLPREQPRRCRARGAAAVTVRPWSHTRARERRGARSSPSPARPAASARSAWGAAVVAAAALGPAQPRSPLASRPEGTSQHTSGRRPLPHRLPAPRDVSTSCRTEHATRHAPSARKMSTRTPRG